MSAWRTAVSPCNHPLYGELATGKRPTGRPQLSFNDICTRELKALAINPDTWEALASDRCVGRREMRKGLELSVYEDALMQRAEEKTARRKSQTQADS